MKPLINTDFIHLMVLKIVPHIDDHFNSLFTIISTPFNKNGPTKIFSFFSFLNTKDGKQDYE